MTPVIDLRHADVVRGGRTVLHDVSFTLAAGEQIVLLGPNGCGKSTLLKLVTCELYPLANPQTHVRLFGRERWDLTEVRRRLGVVQAELPGRPMLALSGRDAVLTGFFSSSTLWPNLVVTEAMRERTETVMQLTATSSLGARIFGEMSAGQQRRILIARALVASAECLLLDEPSNTLDLYAQRELRDLLIALAQQGTTILLITHQVADIIPSMQRVIMMQQGRITQDGPRAELLTAQALGDVFGVKIRLEENDGVLHAW